MPLFPTSQPSPIDEDALWQACVHEAAHVVVLRAHGRRVDVVQLSHRGGPGIAAFNGMAKEAAPPRVLAEADHVPATAVAGCLAEIEVRQGPGYLAKWSGDNTGDLWDGLEGLILRRSGGDFQAVENHAQILRTNGMDATLEQVGAEAARSAASILRERWTEVTAVAIAIRDGFVQSGSRTVTLRESDLP